MSAENSVRQHIVTSIVPRCLRRQLRIGEALCKKRANDRFLSANRARDVEARRATAHAGRRGLSSSTASRARGPACAEKRQLFVRNLSLQRARRSIVSEQRDTFLYLPSLATDRGDEDELEYNCIDVLTVCASRRRRRVRAAAYRLNALAAQQAQAHLFRAGDASWLQVFKPGRPREQEAAARAAAHQCHSSAHEWLNVSDAVEAIRGKDQVEAYGPATSAVACRRPHGL